MIPIGAYAPIQKHEHSTMDRKIAALLPGERIIDDGDMVLYRGLPAPDRVSIDPCWLPMSDRFALDSRAVNRVRSFILNGGKMARHSE